jgi:hypothetical protein
MVPFEHCVHVGKVPENQADPLIVEQKWQTRRKAGTQSHGAKSAGRAPSDNRRTTTMNITKRVKIAAGALALAGAVTLTGGAFTASGLTNGDGDEKFVGGTVTQTVTGAATLDTVTYAYTDVSNLVASSVQLAFGSITAGSAVSVAADGAASVACTETVEIDGDTYDCNIVDANVAALAITVAEA